jgi:hypothetical protein
MCFNQQVYSVYNFINLQTFNIIKFFSVKSFHILWLNKCNKSSFPKMISISYFIDNKMTHLSVL